MNIEISQALRYLEEANYNECFQVLERIIPQNDMNRYETFKKEFIAGKMDVEYEARLRTFILNIRKSNKSLNFIFDSSKYSTFKKILLKYFNVDIGYSSLRYLSQKYLSEYEIHEVLNNYITPSKFEFLNYTSFLRKTKNYKQIDILHKKSIVDFCAELLTQQRNLYLLILADSDMGKTTLMQGIFKKYVSWKKHVVRYR